MVLEPASPPDLPQIVEIQRLAYLHEVTAPFFFSDFPNPTTMTNYFSSRTYERLTDRDTTTLKVTDTSTNEIMGFVAWIHKYSDGWESEPEPPDYLKPNAAGGPPKPIGINVEFVKAVVAKLAKLERVMAGKECFRP